MYSWDNLAIATDQILEESGITDGLYIYEFEADSQFDVGKAYTYIVTESVTGGMVTGSGVVESMTLTAVAGLAAAAPEAESAAKKALEAIKAVEAAVVSGENINIALTLKNLKESVEELPAALAMEGTSDRITKSVNAIAEKLNAFGMQEGYDFTDLLEEAIGESPTIKEVRKKTEAVKMIVELLLHIFEAKFGGTDTPIVSTSLATGSIRFRIIAVNPSKVKTQNAKVKTYLPVEVRPKDIVDTGVLGLEYDHEMDCYYVYKDVVELANFCK